MQWRRLTSMGVAQIAGQRRCNRCRRVSIHIPGVGPLTRSKTIGCRPGAKAHRELQPPGHQLESGPLNSPGTGRCSGQEPMGR